MIYNHIAEERENIKELVISCRGGIDWGKVNRDFYDICRPISFNNNKLPERYIINENATILFWEDGDKTIVRRDKKDKHDKAIAFLYAYFQKNSGMSKSKANKYLKDLVEEEKKTKKKKTNKVVKLTCENEQTLVDLRKTLGDKFVDEFLQDMKGE